jgi:DNA mismatch endonuclease (patch repair protein)
MADTFDPAMRSWIMSRVLSRDTKPEKLVGEILKQNRIRFSSEGKNLPGKPDIVIRSIRLAVFVNGCFWHWHGCKRCRMPASNVAYWERKIARNVARDKRTKRALALIGWHYCTVWECSVSTGVTRLIGKARKLEAAELSEN